MLPSLLCTVSLLPVGRSAANAPVVRTLLGISQKQTNSIPLTSRPVHSSFPLLQSDGALKPGAWAHGRSWGACSYRSLISPAVLPVLPLDLRVFSAFVLEQVSEATVTIVERPWERVVVDGKPHSHGFKVGVEKHTTEVTVKKYGSLLINSGIQGYSLLKTTQSGFEGFVRDRYTLLPDTRERMVATEVTAWWRYPFKHVSQLPSKPFCFTQRYQDVKKVLAETFFGPPDVGVYSPSVQNTLYLMAKEVLSRFPDISTIQLRMPNLHFLPVNLSSKENPGLVKFADDVYLPTDEPHGTIEATLSRPISKL